MREILFRGKKRDNGEWAYGDLCQVLPGCECKFNLIFSQDECATSSIVLPETVGQYIGLIDKNGKKIFEGDILNVHDQIPMFDGYDTDEIVYNGKVMYIDNQGMYVCEGDKNGNALCALNLDECEIIGNIHDNPELLEEKE